VFWSASFDNAHPGVRAEHVACVLRRRCCCLFLTMDMLWCWVSDNIPPWAAIVEIMARAHVTRVCDALPSLPATICLPPACVAAWCVASLLLSAAAAVLTHTLVHVCASAGPMPAVFRTLALHQSEDLLYPCALCPCLLHSRHPRIAPREGGFLPTPWQCVWWCSVGPLPNTPPPPPRLTVAAWRARAGL